MLYQKGQQWIIHLKDLQTILTVCLHVYQDFVECLKKIDEQLRACGGQSEYPLYIKGNTS